MAVGDHQLHLFGDVVGTPGCDGSGVASGHGRTGNVINFNALLSAERGKQQACRLLHCTGVQYHIERRVQSQGMQGGQRTATLGVEC